MTKPQTTAREIRKRFIGMLVLATLVMGTAIITVVGYQQVRQTQQSATRLMTGLRHSVIDNQPDWHWWRRYSAINTIDTYVRVTNHEDQTTQRYYSPFTREFLSLDRHRVLGTRAVAYTPEFGFTYYRQSYHRGNRLEIWLNLTPIIETLLTVVIVVLLVMAATILLGSAYVRVMARKITQPLASLNVAAQAQTQQHEKKMALPVPTQPVEVQELAESFNALLQTVNDHAVQERQFTSNAAHELRTPIAAILTHVQLLKRRAAEHPEIVPQSIAFIGEESLRMKQLVDSLLTLSRADRAVLTMAPTDLAAVAQDVVATERLLIKQPLTFQGTATLVMGNAESIAQILTALIDNAAKYSPETAPITVQISTTSTAHQVVVKDQGMGISDAHKAHIFERFYRVDAARTPAIAGTGLGLAIVAQLAKANQGTITVSDNQPQGSQFILSFPRQQAHSEKISE